MASLSITKIICNETSGGQIQLMVGNIPLLPSEITMNPGDEIDFDHPINLGEVIGTTFFIDLYDSRFSSNQSVHQTPISALMISFSTEPFNYDKDRWSDENQDYVSVRGRYDVTYQITSVEQPRIFARARRLAQQIA